MFFTQNLNLRRILNTSYHPFRVIPKPAIWPKRERLKRFTAVSNNRILTEKIIIFQWSYGQDMLTVKQGYKKLNKIFIYMDMQRQDAKRLERHVSWK
jgi:hypothetical protein